MVYESSTGKNLFTAESLQAICRYENDLIRKTKYTSKPDCYGPSVAFYVGVLSNKDCMYLNDEDVRKSLDLLKSCSKYYYNGTLKLGCSSNPLACKTVPPRCYKNNGNAVYNIMHYLTDFEFLKEDKVDNEFLKYAMVFPYVPYEKVIEFYRAKIEDEKLDNGIVKISGVDISRRFTLFNQYLTFGMTYFGVAMMLILLVMCCYLHSFSITMATILDVIFSFLLTYFIYHIVLKFEYFPFMNILTALLLIAVGADDVFIFFDTWQQMKNEVPNAPLHKRISKTLQHAALSIFVTSLTTSAAFFACYVSEITAVKTFGIFSGMAILMNFIMMITWIPAVVVMIEVVSQKFCKNMVCCLCWDKLVEFFSSNLKVFFFKILPRLVINFWYVWLILFLGLGVSGFILVFVSPRLELPSTANFQIFPSHSPLEVYSQKLKKQFRYIKETESKAYGLPIFLVWGVEGNDNGDWANPSDNGRLYLDSNFKIDEPKSQDWMTDLCDELKNQSFVYTEEKRKPCITEAYKKMMTSPCPPVGLPSSPCCGHSSTKRVESWSKYFFHQCIPETVTYQTAMGEPFLGQPFYDSNNKVRALVLTVLTNQEFTPKFKEMDKFYSTINDFMDKETDSAPNGLENGWVSGHQAFNFYDLQRSLSQGSYFSIVVSLSVAFCVMLATSLNIVISLYAILTITLAISVTVGVLVLFGWELNILESVIISLAVGLSIDFTIHYGVAYRLADGDRKRRVEQSFNRVAPAVAMAAFTTFLAGSVCMPARVLAYQQLGIFLMLVMFTSWTFSTFFFMSLCTVLGPQGNFGQIVIPVSWCPKKKERFKETQRSYPGPRLESISNGETCALAKHESITLKNMNGEKEENLKLNEINNYSSSYDIQAHSP